MLNNVFNNNIRFYSWICILFRKYSSIIIKCHAIELLDLKLEWLLTTPWATGDNSPIGQTPILLIL